MKFMIQNKGLLKFAKAMEKILNEKFPKYRDTWRSASMEYLKKKLEEQVKKLTLPTPITTISKEETKRTLAKIAAYCALISFKLDLYNSGSKKDHKWRPWQIGGD